MDYDKFVKDRQDKFLKNPRKGIENFIKEMDGFVKGLSSLSLIQNRPMMLVLFYEIHKEYGALIGSLYKLRVISPRNFKDDEKDIGLVMRIRETQEVVIDYQNKIKPLDVSALALSRVYATYIELFFKKLRNIVFLSGLNPKMDFLDKNKLTQKIEELEKIHNIKMTKIKSLLSSEIRNSVDHENSRFQAPNLMLFLRKDGTEIERFTTEQICERAIEFTIINMALEHIEKMVVRSHLENLLKLTDEQLDEYFKTGVLTPEMEKRYLGHRVFDENNR